MNSAHAHRTSEAKFRSLELRLEESEKAGQCVSQANFKEKENTENKIKTLQEVKKKLEVENNKLSNECTMLKHKLK